MGYNKIIYGAPGVGKSFSIQAKVGGNYRLNTTFHPEYTYFDFVGGYKPILQINKEENKFHYYDSTSSTVNEKDYILNREKMAYKFAPGPFLEAYVLAWKEYLSKGKEVFLVIEELNRGNCSAIFGEVFQLLDRDKLGASEYFVNVNEAIANYLKDTIGVSYEIEMTMIFDSKKITKPLNLYAVLFIPPNLNIIATMNTSDQSLYPLDSAFKRRWNWEYVPIDYTIGSIREIDISGKKYNWNKFLETINSVIFKLSKSEDKCLGSFFVKSDIISQDEFVGKVLFYLWTECFKDETEDVLEMYLPKTKKVVAGVVPDELIIFNDFFDNTNGTTYIIEFMSKLGL